MVVVPSVRPAVAVEVPASALRGVAIAAPLALIFALGPAMTQWVGAEGTTERHQMLAWGLCSALLLCLAARRVWLGLVLLSPCVVLAPLEAWYLGNYGRASDSHLLGILAETDRAEITAFVGSSWWLLAAALAVSTLVALIAVAAARRARLLWPVRLRRWLVAACVLGLAMPWIVNATAPDVDLGAIGSRLEAPPGQDIAHYGIDPALEPLAQTYPAGLPMRVAEYLRQRQALADVNSHLDGFSFGAQARPGGANAARRQVHVLVIGESSRPDRWQLNGYARPTNPRLSKDANVVSLIDMVSPWAWTRMAVPLILTRKPGSDRNAFFAERSVVSAFREAGFRTHWLSTQGSLGPHDSSIALHAREAHEQRFVNPSDYRTAAVVDGDLLPWLDDVLRRGETKQFIVLHTLGSHYNYSHRHPPTFDHFAPTLRGHPRPTMQDRAQRAEMNNAYDNTVRYTDHVLAEIIARLKRLDTVATLFYVSDHGENLFDGDCPYSGHGRNTERDHRSASVFWHSDLFAKFHADKVSALRAHAAAPLATTQVFASLLDAADITFPGEDLRRSFFSEQWRAQPRIVQSGLDFDRAARGPLCQELKPTPASAS